MTLFDTATNALTVSLSVNSVITDKVIGSPAPIALYTAASELEILAHREDDSTLEAALKAADIKKRIIAGEAGDGVKWMDWMLKNVRISRSQLYALVRIGSARIPTDALEAYRRKARQRSKDRVGSTDLSDYHRQLLRVVKKLSDEEAKREYLKLPQSYTDRINR